MPAPWLHIQWGTFGSWLPGDPRGFRNHQHRIHSSGDYRHPPPPGEHAGLHAYATRVKRQAPVALGPDQRRIACAAIVAKACSIGLELACLAVARTHVHLLAQLDPSALRDTLARLKRHSSHALRGTLPGRVWSARWHVVRIRDRAHQVTVFPYILAHEAQGASVWDCRDRAAQRREIPGRADSSPE